MAKTDLAAIDAQLAERAASLSQQLGSSDSRRVTVDQKTGELIGPGGLSFGDEQNIIVVDFCTINRYFDTPYNAANPGLPACIAIGDILAEMTPEDGVPAKQSDLCRTCWANEWESAPSGKGKACQNKRALAIVFADELEDPDHEPEFYIVECSPTSLKSFDAAAKKAQQLFGSTPIKAIMNMKVVAVENYYNLRFGDVQANPYLERVFPLLEDTAEALSQMPDFSKYTAPKRLPAGDVRAA